MSYIYSFGEDVGLDDLVKCYIETKRTQIHARVTQHIVELRACFEAALGVAIPEKPESPNAAVWMLFFAITHALASERGPLEGILEGGLIFVQLERMGLQHEEEELVRLDRRRAQLRSEHVALAARLFAALTGADPSKRVSIDDLGATGIYPGRTPADFDIFEHL